MWCINVLLFGYYNKFCVVVENRNAHIEMDECVRGHTTNTTERLLNWLKQTVRRVSNLWMALLFKYKQILTLIAFSESESERMAYACVFLNIQNAYNAFQFSSRRNNNKNNKRTKKSLVSIKQNTICMDFHCARSRSTSRNSTMIVSLMENYGANC